MAVALKDRPVLTFQPPPGVTMASWDSGCGTVHRRVQAGPGARRLRPLGGGVAGGRRRRRATPAERATAGPGGVDSGMGGLY